MSRDKLHQMLKAARDAGRHASAGLRQMGARAKGVRSANRPANWAPPTKWRQTPETGGGIHVTDGGRLTARHSTVTRSIANANGGGIYSTGVLTVEHTTVSRNTANSSSDVPAEGRRDPPARRRSPSRTAPCPTGGRGTRGHRGVRGNRWPLTDRSRRYPRVRRPGPLCRPRR